VNEHHIRLFGDHGDGVRTGRRRHWGIPGCLAVLVALVVLLGGGYLVLTRGVDALVDRIAGPEDYPGPGVGRVLVEVKAGQTGADIGNTLKSVGVVKSVEAFTDAYRANADASSAGIQAGFYRLKRQMKAEDAVERLVDPDNQVTDAVTIPEGLRVVDVVALLAKETDHSAKDFNAALKRSKQLGLPSYAKGSAEGYLFPATYEFPPRATAAEMLTMMVDKWRVVAEEAGITKAARAQGVSRQELMTIASLIEAEARPKYMAQVSRVIYNRLDNAGEPPTNGLLQLDATVNYAHGRNIGARTTREDRGIDSPYNTYRNPGLPPGPIEAPGQAAIEAAARPASGPWLFYVTTNLATGETKFATTVEGHNRNVQELNEYCRTRSERC
jgi:UPF0755 protein